MLMFYPALEEALMLAAEYNTIPVAMEVYADMETPISIFKRFSDSPGSFLLESVEGGEKWGRYSFVGSSPFLVTESRGRITRITDKSGVVSVREGNPVAILEELMKKYRSPGLKGMPRFSGGAVGCFGYDLIRQYEKLADHPEDDLDLPDCHFMFADELIVFDHLKQKMLIIVNMHVKPGSLNSTDNYIERLYNSTVARIREIYRLINSMKWKADDTGRRRALAEQKTTGQPVNHAKNRIETDYNKAGISNMPNMPNVSDLPFVSNISKEKFCSNVTKARQYIREGDIFQVVLSQRLSIEARQDPFDVYRVLRTINPSPYMYFLKFNDYTVAGASPEMLVRVEGRDVETCPIAGTRKRGGTPEEDEALEAELLADPKELAEHTMLVDLGRNDIGKVSEFGSVKAENMMHVEKFSHVMHIVTNVKGRLRPDRNAFDALVSVLPAGTVSGAPKIRAMDIISELETAKRGLYAGAIGYLSFNGNIDSCITIRTVIFKDSKAYVQVGAGIVADSVPETEYTETMNKAMAMLKAIKEADNIL